MRVKILLTGVAGVFLLSACGGSTENTTPASGTGNQYFTGGVSCGVSGDTSTNTETVTGTGDLLDAVDCSADLDTSLPGPGIAATGSGSLIVTGDVRPISAAMIDISYRNTIQDFIEVDFQLHDGNIRSLVQQSSDGSDTTTRVDWGIYDATILLSMEIRQAGSASFTGGSFDVVRFVDGEAPEQENYAFEPALFIDKRSDGILTASDEILQVASGNVNITGTEPDWSVTVDLTLEDGTSVTGAYAGTFYQLPNW